MQFITLEAGVLTLSELFNLQHASHLIETIKTNIHTLRFVNVSIKVMRFIIEYFQEIPISTIVVSYNWNTIMTKPNLVCYDKNQWKTLQQLNNWNREWRELFQGSNDVTKIIIELHCSWMDEDYAQLLLEGVAQLPNIRQVQVHLSSKNKKIQNVLTAFQKAQIFPQYEHRFQAIE